MFRQVRFILILGGLAFVVDHRVAKAGHWFHNHKGTPPPGCPRAIAHTHARAGDPLCISSHARPTYTPSYVSYYVGGGSACLGCARRGEDGTWGRDYQGIFIPRNVGLGWSYGRLYQGGTGYYESDGHPVPDVIGLTASKIRNH